MNNKRNYGYWSEEQLDFIKKNSNVLTDKQLVIAFNEHFEDDKSFGSIRKMRQRTGVAKANGRGICRVIDTKDKENEDLPNSGN